MPLTQTLTEARIELHYAIQLIAVASRAFNSPDVDHSQSSLDWNPEHRWFTRQMLAAPLPFQVALEPASLTAMVLDQTGSQISAFPLDQQTLDEALDWLKQTLSQLGLDTTGMQFVSYPPDDFPDHPVAHGAAFSATAQSMARQQVANYYDLTLNLLKTIVTITPSASPIRIWPHHFDMATLISLPGTQNNEALSIGVGFSPGDHSYNEPYWYVTPWPYPETTNLPALEGGGTWHTEHWVGALLRAGQLLETEPSKQQNQVQHFLTSAIQGAKALLVNP